MPMRYTSTGRLFKAFHKAKHKTMTRRLRRAIQGIDKSLPGNIPKVHTRSGNSDSGFTHFAFSSFDISSRDFPLVSGTTR
jgi:hypothetical protein